MTWLERLNAISINPDMATREDIARMATELSELQYKFEKCCKDICKNTGNCTPDCPNWPLDKRGEDMSDPMEWVSRSDYDYILNQLYQAKGILQDLVDLQNGPPLLQHKQEWELTMKRAIEILKVKI